MLRICGPTKSPRQICRRKKTYQHSTQVAFRAPSLLATTILMYLLAGALVGTFVKVKRSIPIATKWVFCDGFARVSVSQDIQIKDVAADDPLHPILFLDAAAWGRRCRLQNGRASDAGGEDLFADPSCSDECEHDEFAFGRKRRKTLREVIGGGRAGPCS